MGVILSGHFVYASRLHGDKYFDKDALLASPKRLSVTCLHLAEKFFQDGVEVVAAPAASGIALSQWVSFHLPNVAGYKTVGAVFSEKSGPIMTFRNRFRTLLKGKRILIVEDTVNRGGTVRKVIDAVRFSGGNVIGVGALCKRGGLTVVDLGVPKFEALITVDWPSYHENACPLCEKEVPIDTSVDHGLEFLAQKGKSG